MRLTSSFVCLSHLLGKQTSIRLQTPREARKIIEQRRAARNQGTANLRTKILDFRGFDSSRILVSRGGIFMSTGNFPESLSQKY